MKQKNQGIIKVEASDYTCRDLDYSEYHKNRIQLLFIIHYFMENTQKLLCEMCVDFIWASIKILGQTYQAAVSLKTTQVLAFFSQRRITHALRAV